jgi:translation initiation factor 5B
MFNFAEKYVNPSQEGVCVQASTLGSLEALLEFLKTSKIPVCSVNIGIVYKKDIMKALKAIQGEKNHKEYATLLAFDVKVEPEAREYAEENGVKIFEADIIYHLFDQFTEYVAKCKDDRKVDEGAKAVFPCVIEIIKDNIFRTANPMLIGCEVKAGVVKIGTPLCVPYKNKLKIGVVTGIQKEKKDILEARPKDGGISLKILNEKQVQAKRDFDHDNQLASLLTRGSIDALKTFFRDDMTADDWKLVVKLKGVYEIQ